MAGSDVDAHATGDGIDGGQLLEHTHGVVGADNVGGTPRMVLSMAPSKFIRSTSLAGSPNYVVSGIKFETEDMGKRPYASSTLSTLLAGSLNQAISGPPPRKMPLASVSSGVPA